MRNTLTPVDICCSQAQFSSTLLENDAFRIHFLELFRYLSCFVWTSVVDNDDLIINATVYC